MTRQEDYYTDDNTEFEGEQGNKEQQPRRSILKALIGWFKGNRSSEINSADIETQLFRYGVYYYDHEREIAQAIEEYERSAAWYEQNPYWDELRTAQSLEEDKIDIQHDLLWKKHFSGTIPANWFIWYRVMGDFEEAGRYGVQFNDHLIDAGVTHPHHLVVNETGKTQHLNERQLAIILYRNDIPEWNKNQILESQRQMGMSWRTLRAAENYSESSLRQLSRRENRFISMQRYLTGE